MLHASADRATVTGPQLCMVSMALKKPLALGAARSFLVSRQLPRLRFPSATAYKTLRLRANVVLHAAADRATVTGPQLCMVWTKPLAPRAAQELLARAPPVPQCTLASL